MRPVHWLSRVATLLRAAGHRVDASDLAASSIDARRLHDVPTFEDYTRPLLDALQALPPGKRAVLVGHSFGGMSIALATEMFPDKVAAAVFVTAFLPDCTNPRSHPIEKLTLTDWMDSITDAEHVPSLVFLGPEFLRQKLYQLSPPEDYTLSQSLARVSSYYVADLQSQSPFREDRYDAVSKVYIICKQDQAMMEAYQRAMIIGCPMKEMNEIANADHMAMFSPRRLSSLGTSPTSPTRMLDTIVGYDDMSTSGDRRHCFGRMDLPNFGPTTYLAVSSSSPEYVVGL